MRLQDHIAFTTLQWVKPELDETLGIARQELESYVDQGGGRGSLVACARSLHQVLGTLRMVELYGAAMVAEEMEALALALEGDQVAQREEAYAVLMRGLMQLPDYLERLSSGHRDVPVVLLPLLNDLRAARGAQALQEWVMFTPQLETPLPTSAPGVVGDSTAEQRRGHIAELRARFQQQLLSWFRGQDGARQLALMRQSLDGIAAQCHSIAGRRLWWIAAGVLEGLEQGALKSHAAEVRQLIGKVDRSIRQLLEQGEASLAEGDAVELARKLLYLVAQSRQGTPRLDVLRKTYKLDGMLPDAADIEHARGSMSGHNRALLDSVSRALKDDLLKVKDALDLYLRRPEHNIARLGEQLGVLERVGDTLGMLALAVPRRVVNEQRRVLEEMSQQLRTPDEEALLDVAGALLYVEASLDDHIERLGSNEEESSEEPQNLLPRSEARQILATLMQEAIANTNQVKEAIVGFVESGWQHDGLAPVPALMEQVAGALRMLSAPRPADLADGIGRFVGNELLLDRRVPDSVQMDKLADALAALEYYLEAAREHRGGLDHILDVAQLSLGALGYWPLPPARYGEAAEAPSAVAEATPSEPITAPPLSESVSVVPGDDPSALFVGSAGEPETAGHELAGLRLVETGEPQVEPVAPQEPAWIEVEEEVFEVPDDPRLAMPGFQRGEEGIDEDIREIFLEEMQEEIEQLQAARGPWLAEPQRLELAAPLRRAFHTLKGSGRLVGASLLGEFAWTVENLLNRVLEGSVAPGAEVQALVGHAIDALPALQASLRTDQPPQAPVLAIIEAAQKLAAGELARVEDQPSAGRVVRRTVRRPVDDAQLAAAAVPAATLAGIESQSVEPAAAPDEPLDVDPALAEPALPPIDAVLLEILRSEVAQYLQTIRAVLLRTRGELKVDDGLLRAVHTLHGAIAMVDIPLLIQLLSPLESLLKRLRAAGEPLSAEGVRLLGRCADVVDEVMALFDVEQPVLPAVEPLVAQLVALRDTQPEPQIAHHLFEPQEDEREPAVEPAPGEGRQVNQLTAQLMEALDAFEQGQDAATPAATHASLEASIAALADPLPELGGDHADLGETAGAGESSASSRLPVASSADETPHTDAASPAEQPHAVASDLTDRPPPVDEPTPSLPEVAAPAESVVDEATAHAETDPSAALHAGHDEALHETPQHDGADAGPAPDTGSSPVEHALVEAASPMPSDADAPPPTDEAEASAAVTPPTTTEPPADSTSLSDTAQAETDHASVADSPAQSEPLADAVLTADTDMHDGALPPVADDAADTPDTPDASPLADQPLVSAEADAPAGTPDDVPPSHAAVAEAAEMAGAPEVDASTAADPRVADEVAALEAELAEVLAAEQAAQDERMAALEASAPEPAPTPGPADDAVTADASPFADIDPDLLEIFVEEAREILDHAEGEVAQWRAAPQERAHVAALQRDLHTLKGGARIAGLVPVGDLSHALETLLDRLAGGELAYEGAAVEAVEAGFDQLHGLVQRVAQGQAIERPEAMIARLLALSGGAAEAEGEQGGSYAPTTPMPSAFAPSATAWPLPELLPESHDEPRGSQEQIRVRADLLDTLVNHAGEVAIYRSRLEQQVAGYRFNLVELDQTVARLRNQLRALEIETEAQIIARFQREHREAGMAAFDPLELDRYSQLQQYSRALAESVSDLVSLQGSLDELTRQAETLLIQQSRVSSELQDGLLRTRMLPFDTMVPNLRRTLRQAASEQGKSAQLFVEGAHGEMDRNLLDRIKAPFEHMLRNAVAHGIESPEQRRAAGKPVEGAVRIHVAREATEVVIRVSDDGRGLDREAIRQRALARGLLHEDARAGDEQLLNLITQPGFSTADELTQLAGRGVGMDVVANEIKQLGGSLSVESQPGRGTTFVLRLPFTLAVTQAILVKLGDATFAIPMTSVQGVARIGPDELAARLAEPEPRFDYDGELYDIHHLSELLGQPASPATDEAQLPLLLTRSGELRAAIRIDAVIGSREIVVKSVGPQISSVPGILGATIMGDGSVLVILDLAPLVRHGMARRRQRLEQGLPAQPAAAVVEPRGRPLVMVVDDSITMRKVTGRVLERNDFDVLTAKDGIDALEKLAERVPDLLLLDIEMPRMDGYELAAQMREDARLRAVPIIMITSRTGEKHRQRAFDLGVRRYLGKPYQEAELLLQIGEVLGTSGVEAAHG